MSKTKDECILCLRPANVSPTDSARFACRYVRIGVHHVRQIGLVGALSVVVPETLERELLSLTDQAAGNR
ncbi:MAG TPA: hypothetical protein VEG08_04490 [Terriglobales bacterium]|nr:hypothetical protein [Terriglobales bacterium]